jgi:hypothetical protein
LLIIFLRVRAPVNSFENSGKDNAALLLVANCPGAKGGKACLAQILVQFPIDKHQEQPGVDRHGLPAPWAVKSRGPKLFELFFCRRSRHNRLL